MGEPGVKPFAALLAAAGLAACGQPAPTATRGRPHGPAGPAAVTAGSGVDAAATPRPPEPATSSTVVVTPPTTTVDTLSAGVDAGTAPGLRTPTPAGPTTTVTMVVTTTSPLVVTPTTIRMPLPEDDGAGQTARASWYAEGAYTANGDRFDPNGLTFAHLTLPFGTRVLFSGPLGSVVAICTDRGPEAWTGRTFDLSRGTFSRIAQLSAGVATVTWSVVG